MVMREMAGPVMFGRILDFCGLFRSGRVDVAKFKHNQGSVLCGCGCFEKSFLDRLVIELLRA